MKRFLIYLVVIIGALFVGLMTYYLARNDENIDLTIAEGSTIYLNPGETYELPLEWTKPSSRTSVEITPSQDAIDSIAYYNEETNKIETRSSQTGGTVVFTITPSNEDFGPFTFSVWVGNGSPQNPYFISTAAQLNQVGKIVSWGLSKSYRMIESIDLAGLEGGWTPIGTQSAPFTGSFDGGLYSIYNLEVESTDDCAGLFGAISSSSTIENLILENVNITSSSTNVGAIAGYSEGTILRCQVSNLVINNDRDEKDDNVGGIAGFILKGKARPYIEMCEVLSADIQGTNYVGGIVGKSEAGVIFNCKADANFSEAESSAPNYVGGIVGYSQSKSESQVVNLVSNTYNRGTIIKNCISVSTFDIDDSNTKKGTVIGFANSSKVNSSDPTSLYANQFYGNYYYLSIDTISSVGDTGSATVFDAGELKSVSELYDEDTFATSESENWDFENVWEIQTNTTLPYVRLDGQRQSLGMIEEGTSITQANALTVLGQIRTDATLKAFNYTVKENISLDLGGAEWTPIGTESSPFTGQIIVEGDYTFEIKNFKITVGSATETRFLGFFGYISGNSAKISGITFKNISIIKSEDSTSLDYVGGVVGYNKGGTIENINIEGISISAGDTIGFVAGFSDGIIKNINIQQYMEGETVFGTIMTISENGKKTVGEIVGENNGLIEATSVIANINVVSDNDILIGGIAGKSNGKIVNCYINGGTIDASSSAGLVNAGGVAGWNGGSIMQSYSIMIMTIEIDARNFAGGLAGFTAASSDISQSFSQGTYKCYNVGGFTGDLNGTLSECYAKSTLQGNIAGGFATKINGSAYNSYNICSIEGLSDEGEIAGFCVFFNGYMEKCYSGASLIGKGQLNAGFGYYNNDFISLLFHKDENYGKLSNVVYNKSTAKTSGIYGTLQSSIELLNKDVKFIKVEIPSNILSESDKENFVNSLGFSEGIWRFTSEHMPELVNLDFSAVKQFESEEE